MLSGVNLRFLASRMQQDLNYLGICTTCFIKLFAAVKAWGFLGHFLADAFLLSSSLARDRNVQRLDVKFLPVCDTCQSVTVNRRTYGLDSEPGVARVGAHSTGG